MKRIEYFTGPRRKLRSSEDSALAAQSARQDEIDLVELNPWLIEAPLSTYLFAGIMLFLLAAPQVCDTPLMYSPIQEMLKKNLGVTSSLVVFLLTVAVVAAITGIVWAAARYGEGKVIAGIAGLLMALIPSAVAAANIRAAATVAAANAHRPPPGFWDALSQNVQVAALGLIGLGAHLLIMILARRIGESAHTLAVGGEFRMLRSRRRDLESQQGTEK